MRKSYGGKPSIPYLQRIRSLVTHSHTQHIQGDQTKKLDAIAVDDKSKAKGSTILNVIAYFFIAQIFVFVAAYGYYKLRVHRNEKKYI
jgi:hypothetical protein